MVGRDGDDIVVENTIPMTGSSELVESTLFTPKLSSLLPNRDNRIMWGSYWYEAGSLRCHDPVKRGNHEAAL